MHEEALGRRTSSHRSTPGACGLRQCGFHAIPGANVVSHRAGHVQIDGAREGDRVGGDADLGHR